MTINHEATPLVLGRLLAAIEGSIPSEGVDDISSFIEAGEFGLATDTIFCAISEERIPVSAEIRRDLNDVVGLFNQFEDLDPRIVDTVLSRLPGAHPSMR